MVFHLDSEKDLGKFLFRIWVLVLVAAHICFPGRRAWVQSPATDFQVAAKPFTNDLVETVDSQSRLFWDQIITTQYNPGSYVLHAMRFFRFQFPLLKNQLMGNIWQQ